MPPDVGKEFYRFFIEIFYKIGFSKGKIGFFNSREHGDAGGIIFIDFGASYEKSIFTAFAMKVQLAIIGAVLVAGGILFLPETVSQFPAGTMILDALVASLLQDFPKDQVSELLIKVKEDKSVTLARNEVLKEIKNDEYFDLIKNFIKDYRQFRDKNVN